MSEEKYQRCQTCNLILTDKMIKKGVCSGHKTKYLTYGNPFEWFLIKSGLFSWYESYYIKHFGEVKV